MMESLSARALPSQANAKSVSPRQMGYAVSNISPRLGSTLGDSGGQTNSADHRTGRIARLTEELLLIKEEMRIKDARMKGIPAQRRPHYLPTERLAILELRAARGWSQAQTTDHMLVEWSSESEGLNLLAFRLMNNRA